AALCRDEMIHVRLTSQTSAAWGQAAPPRKHEFDSEGVDEDGRQFLRSEHDRVRFHAARFLRGCDHLGNSFAREPMRAQRWYLHCVHEVTEPRQRIDRGGMWVAGKKPSHVVETRQREAFRRA